MLASSRDHPSTAVARPQKNVMHMTFGTDAVYAVAQLATDAKHMVCVHAGQYFASGARRKLRDAVPKVQFFMPKIINDGVPLVEVLRAISKSDIPHNITSPECAMKEFGVEDAHAMAIDVRTMFIVGYPHGTSSTDYTAVPLFGQLSQKVAAEAFVRSYFARTAVFAVSRVEEYRLPLYVLHARDGMWYQCVATVGGKRRLEGISITPPTPQGAYGIMSPKKVERPAMEALETLYQTSTDSWA